MDGIEREFNYARQELYSDSDSPQEKIVEGVADSETGNNQIVLWQNTTKTTETEAEEEENQPLPPVRMFLEPSQYHNAIKLGTSCYIHKAVVKMESLDLEPHELSWFREHPQFKHFWYMHRAMHEGTTHKMMGMWLLLLRTANKNKKKEAWFVVYGVPIRYSLREHALLCGLNCLAYPEDYESIWKTKTGKGAPSVDPLFLRIVDDTEASKRFPWGRYSFDVNMKEIEHTMRHFKGVVETNAWTFPSFVTPLELLVFEVIPCLKNKYREYVRGAERDRPRVCRQKFQPFTIKDGVIMLLGVMEGNEEEDVGDIVPDNCTRHLVEEKKPIFWKEICKINVDARDNKE
ncbi:uncharacterized protein At3g43530-like [Eutrema salsugineum]|uniref:uncharacterized protein At3g43530-like n=1 Tax=Eutrema salsugineum TaxID=72664 RepID=UPI000CED5DC4|nr:uncharacterized protein At3g43530-like [Eutrema salsugineum]